MSSLKQDHINAEALTKTKLRKRLRHHNKTQDVRYELYQREEDEYTFCLVISACDYYIHLYLDPNGSGTFIRKGYHSSRAPELTKALERLNRKSCLDDLNAGQVFSHLVDDPDLSFTVLQLASQAEEDVEERSPDKTCVTVNGLRFKVEAGDEHAFIHLLGTPLCLIFEWGPNWWSPVDVEFLEDDFEGFDLWNTTDFPNLHALHKAFFQDYVERSLGFTKPEILLRKFTNNYYSLIHSVVQEFKQDSNHFNSSPVVEKEKEEKMSTTPTDTFTNLLKLSGKTAASTTVADKIRGILSRRLEGTPFSPMVNALPDEVMNFLMASAVFYAANYAPDGVPGRHKAALISEYAVQGSSHEAFRMMFGLLTEVFGEVLDIAKDIAIPAKDDDDAIVAPAPAKKAPRKRAAVKKSPAVTDL